MNKDDEIFKGKTLGGLLKDVYKKSTEKDRQIKMLIGELRPLIKNIGDATIIVPLIREYLDLSVKNDDHLIKIAGIVQRLIASEQRAISGAGENFLLTEEEKQQLLSELDEIEASADGVVEKKDTTELDAQIDDIRNKLGTEEETNEEEDEDTNETTED